MKDEAKDTFFVSKLFSDFLIDLGKHNFHSARALKRVTLHQVSAHAFRSSLTKCSYKKVFSQTSCACNMHAACMCSKTVNFSALP